MTDRMTWGDAPEEAPDHSLYGEQAEQLAVMTEGKTGSKVAAGVMTKDAIGDAIGSLTIETSGPATTGADLERLQLYYESQLWVYACAKATAETLASIPLYAVGPPEAAEVIRTGKAEITDLPRSRLQAFIDSPSPGLTRMEMVERVALNLLLTGTTFLYAERAGRRPTDRDGEFNELRPLRTSRVRMLPGPVPGGVTKYIHNVQGRETEISPDNLGKALLPNPNDDFWGIAPAVPVISALDSDYYSSRYNRNLVEGSGNPDAVATTPKHLGRVAKRRMEHDWDRRFRTGSRGRRAGGLLVMDDDLKIGPSGFSPKDMEFATLVRENRQRILAAYGVPPVVVMDLSDSSILQNTAVQWQLYYTRAVIPLGERIAAMLTRLVRQDPRWSQNGWGVRFAWEEAQDRTSPDDERVAKEHYQAGGITLNEYRRVIGQPPVDDGDQFVQPATSPLGGLFGLQAGGGGGAPAVRRGAVRRVSDEHKALARVSFARILRRSAAEFAGELRSFFDDQGARIAGRVRTLGLKGSARRKADISSILALLFPDEEREELRRAIGPMFLAASIDAGEAKLEELFGDDSLLQLTEDNERFRNLVDTWGANRIVGISDATRDDVRQVIDVSLQDASTSGEIEERLLDLFQRYNVGPAGSGDVETRVERISRTESATALNAGSFTAALDATSLGISLRKSWLSARDARVRPEHAALDAQTSVSPIPINERFANGLMYPSDVGGKASSVVNCRCSMIELVED